MAKKDVAVTIGAIGPPKGPKTVRISLPEGQKLSGTPGLLAHGKRVCVRVEGKVTGHTMDEFGGSITIEPTQVIVEKPEGYHPETEPMTDRIKRLGTTKEG